MLTGLLHPPQSVGMDSSMCSSQFLSDDDDRECSPFDLNKACGQNDRRKSRFLATHNAQISNVCVGCLIDDNLAQPAPIFAISVHYGDGDDEDEWDSAQEESVG